MLAFELISFFCFFYNLTHVTVLSPSLSLSLSLSFPLSLSRSLLKIKDCVSTSVKDECHSITGSASDLNIACCNVERDYCPDDTPRGATVSTKLETINGETIDPGCTSDTDGDTVYDGLDRCPDTTTKELDMIANSDKMVLDEQGCVVLSPGMWEPTFVEEATVVSKVDGMPNLDLLFTVNKELYDFAKARADLPLVQSQVMDASCIDAFDDLIDTSAPVENAQGSYTGEISADAVPVMVGLDFDISKLIGSTVWTEEPNGVASIDFCLKLSVLSYADASGTFSLDFGTCMHFEQLYFDFILFSLYISSPSHICLHIRRLQIPELLRLSPTRTSRPHFCSTRNKNSASSERRSSSTRPARRRQRLMSNILLRPAVAATTIRVSSILNRPSSRRAKPSRSAFASHLMQIMAVSSHPTLSK